MRGPSSKWVALILGVSVAAAGSAVAAADPAEAELPPTGPGFGEYELVAPIGDDATYAGPATPAALDGVYIDESYMDDLDASARERLAEQGFVVIPARMHLLHEAYADQFWQGTPVFVTTDVAYHYWHLVFDKLLRDLEQERLLPALEALVKGLRANAAAQRDELAGSVLEDDAERVYDLMAATAAVLGLRGKLSDRANAELALIEDHSAALESPLLDVKTDYSVFTPRGHYTRSEALERYFVAMSVLGQHSFTLPEARDPGSMDLAGTDGLRRGILASRLLVGDPELEALWRTIFEPTAFLVGVSDDYTPFELQAAVEATVPGGWADPFSATDDESVVALGQALRAQRPVMVDPERPSVRLMGTRFVLDSWILDQLVSPNVGTQTDPRVLGSPLDLAAAFGSDFALAIQEEAGETEKASYPEQMEAMRAAVASRPVEAWASTVYDAWLAAIEPMWLPHGEAFPDFMRSDAWAAKAQQTGFGSYAELKHDTILYTKQPTGDTGGGMPPPPVRHWVEPDPVAFARLAAVARLTRDGLLARDLLDKDLRRLLKGYISMVDRFAALAEDELEGEPLSEDDGDWLLAVTHTLENLWRQSGDTTGKWGAEGEEDSAIIADIMRGLDPLTGLDEVLEIGTGYFDRIYVIVPNDAGDFLVAGGGVYSYYEFAQPTSDRLTDEAWRQMLRDDAAPDRPSWQDPLFPTSVTDPRQAEPTPQPKRRDLEWELGASLGGIDDYFNWDAYRRSPAGAKFDPFEAGALAGVIFDDLERELHKAVDYVVLFRFPDEATLEAYWQGRAKAASEAAPEREGPCFDGQAGRDTWANGEYLCYLSDSGSALLRWTDERTHTYGIMNAVEGNQKLAILARQWQATRSR